MSADHVPSVRPHEKRGQARLPDPELIRVETVISLVNGFQREAIE